MNNFANQVTTPKTKLWWRWLLLLLLTILAFALVFIPAWFIQPFRAQTDNAVTISYWLKRWSPLATIVVAIIALGFALSLWRARQGIFRKIALVILLLPAFFAAWFARQNHFEWMFNPLPNAAYVTAADANFVPDTDMVLAVEINGEAVAYPVRQMAYHHVVSDVVGGKPITATY